jgi:8-oxo-dGTP pyrophosphatase MutT (NUDIX family)
VVRAGGSLPEPGWNRFDHTAEHRPSGMLVPVLDIDGEAHVVVTKRADALAHRGDWVFPGGGLDPSTDRSTAATAVRETVEELGVAPGAIEVVGQLDTWGPIVTGYVVDVFIGVLATGTVLAPDPAEVAEALALPLSWFTADGAFERRMQLLTYNPDPAGPGPVDPTWIGPYAAFGIRPGEWIWGLQAEVLRALLVHLFQ